jgi:uncharacterized repeat protein (TIGR03803 family)
MNHRRSADQIGECDILNLRRRYACAGRPIFAAEVLERRMLLSGATLTTLASLGALGDASVGAYPEASLVLDGSTLYGTTSYYGDNASAIFSEPTSGGTPTLLTVLNNTGGDDPNGLTISGNTLYYGYNNEVCSLPVTGGTPTVLASFNGADGAGPGDLTVSGSTLYGSADNVFSLPISGGTPTVLSSTISSWGKLVVSGNTLYGANGGEVFSLPTSGGAPTILASFSGDPGPMGGLILSGNTLYGTTEFGGPSGTESPVFATGEVYSVPVTGGTPTVLASFSGTDGAEPLAGLILSGNTLYGTTFAGGNMSLSTDGADAFPGAGTVFSLPVTGGTPTVLVAFNDTDGNGPAAGLIADAAGNLYGTTEYGGAGYSSGTIFELSPTVGAAAKLAFTQQPTNAFAGITISPPVTVAVEDSSENVVTTDNSTVTLSIGSGPSGALGGTLTATAVSGVATFSNLVLSTPGTYTLQASDGSLTGTVSNSFNAIAGWVDTANMNEISGWAYDPTNPTNSANVQVVIAGGPTQTFSADQTRSDLEPVLGSTNHGFTYSTPVLSVGSHTAYVYVVEGNGSKVLLATETLVSQNSLFDEHYYLEMNPDVAAAVAKGIFATGYDHYIKYGQYEGRSPSPYWDEAWYLQANPDVAAAVKAGRISSGFMHYYLYGQYENRPGLLYFNTSYYLTNNPDVAAAVKAGALPSAFEHFVLYGQYEGRAPMKYFSAAVYDADNPDILPYVTGEMFSSDFEHFIEYGQYEGRIASDYYNEAIYLADNPDVALAVKAGLFRDGFQHWLMYGQYEGRTAV